MKRFFKKAFLVLVVLCLIVGSTLPSFAVGRVVDGTIYEFLTNDLDTGTGTQVSVYREFNFTGTYDTESIINGNVVVSAECRGGYLDSHETNLFIDLVARYQGTTYYDECHDLHSSEENTRFLDATINEPLSVVHTKADSYAWIDMTATSGGEDWCQTYIADWYPGQTGWVED